MEMQIAFRLYGDFLWPPVINHADSFKEKKRGVLEIFVVNDTAKPKKTLLVWSSSIIPENLNQEDVEAINKAPNVYDKNLKLDVIYKNTEKAIWVDISELKNGKKGEILKFIGAVAYQQFNRTDKDKDKEEFICPIVKQYKNNNEFICNSELVIGQKASGHHEKNQDFRFNLAISTPVPQSILLSQENLNIFAISCVHSPNIENGLLPLKRLRVGAPQNNSDSKEITIPSGFRLGAKGFCKNKKFDDPEYLAINDNDIWLSDDQPQIQAILDLFKTELKDSKKCELVQDYPNDLSIKFIKNGNSYGLEYRITFISKDNIARVKLAGEKNITRPIGNKVTALLKLTWNIDNENLKEWLANKKNDFNCNYHPQLIWEETLSQYKPTELLQEYMQNANALMEGLLVTTPTKPLTFLPKININQIDQKVFFTLQPDNDFPINVKFGDLIKNTNTLIAKNTDFYVTLYKKSENDNKNVIKVVASFPNFGIDENVELTLKPHSRTIDLPRPTLAIFDINEFKPNKPYSFRLGSLSFEGVKSLFSGQSGIYFFPNLQDKNESYSNKKEPYHTLDIQLKAEIETTDVKPVAVDKKRGERRNLGSKLLIPLNQEYNINGRFTLKLTEDLSTSQDWHLTASLFDKTSEEDNKKNKDGQNEKNEESPLTNQSYVVLSDEPFSIYKFNRIPLSQSGSIENSIVAEYDSDLGQWQFKKTSDYYHFIFPTQAIGEAADKPGRLEIYDVKDSEPPPDKPYPYESKDGLESTYLVEYRLTPSAEIWIKPSDLQRNYFLPEWNVSDIFNERSSYTAFGAPLLAFRGEFLYGLSVGIDTSKEVAVSKHARVAEIEALTGKYILKDFSDGQKNISRWHKLIPMLKARPERLEFWSYNQENETVSPSSFEKGVNFALRRTALHRQPFDHPYFAAKITEKKKEVKEKEVKEKIRFHPQGLPGGALWPLEQWSVLEQLIEHPESSEGTISNIALTPMGGYANQKAKFLNGILSIASHTHFGFLNYQKIEILGRIAGHWHKAKHVIIYQRTTRIGPQFAPKPSEDNRHLKRTRRPVIRKVSEYIEITQPYRSYPDSDCSFMEIAPLEAIRYNSEIIYVDSAWGIDIPGLGYKIPLWNRYSAKERPQVYQKPCISVITLGEGTAKQSVQICVAQECKNPETIYFYSELSSKESNTDLWPIRLGIDCVKSLPSSMYLDNETQDLDLGSDFKQESVTRSLPGLQQFTLQLMPGITKTQINAHRNDSFQERPIYAGIESITFMRAAPGANDKLLEEIYSKFSIELTASRQKANNVERLNLSLSEDTVEAKKQINALITKIEEQLTKAETEANSYKANLETIIIGNPSLVEKIPSCNDFVNDALGGLKRKRLLIRENLSVWQHEVIHKLNLLLEDTVIDNVKEKLVNSILGYLTPSLDQAYNAFDHINKEFENARSIALNLQNELNIGLNQGIKRVGALEQAYQDGTPWSVERLASFEQKIRAEIVSIRRLINTVLRELNERLTLELSNQVNQISKVLNDAIAEEVNSIFAELDAYEKDLDGQFVFLKTVLVEQINILIAKLLQLKSKNLEISNIGGVSEGSKKLIDKINKLIDELIILLNKIKASILTLENPNLESFKDISLNINQLLGKIKDGLATETKVLILKLDKEINENTLLQEFKNLNQSIFDENALLEIWSGLKDNLQDLGKVVDPLVKSAVKLINKLLKNCIGLNTKFNNHINGQLNSISEKLIKAKSELEPSTLIKKLVKKYVDRLLEQIKFETISGGIDELVGILKPKLNTIVEDITGKGGFLDSIDGSIEDIKNDTCKIINDVLEGLGQNLEEELKNYSKELNDIKEKAEKEINRLKEALGLEDINEIKKIIEQIDLNQLSQDIKNTYAHADTYSRRIIDAATSLGSGSAEELPSKLLRIHSAVVNAPELAMIEANIDRMRLAYDKFDKLIKTTPARIMFSRLGDKLKALGLDFPFDGLSSTFKFDTKALEKFDISKLLKNFAGLNGLIKGKIPSNIAEAVRISHEFDKKQSRAWVQIGINLSMIERREIVSISPFAMYLKDSELVASVRLSASADSDKIDETGFAYINTSIEIVVSGQQIVTLEKVKISHSQSGGLNFEFKPQNIKLNPGFKFIQDTLQNIFPDEVGGLNIIKQNGIPIGMEHEFIMPNLSLSYGTSGVSNIQLSNRFKLIAVPNFYIANRFNISSPELPFIFSLFILGGTGYGIVEVEYHPLSEELTVYIEIAAGGSAALAFSFGPVNGSVFITLSFALNYKKLSTQSSGSLAISLILLIAGVVRLFSLVNVYLGLLLRLCYHENGQIDGRGDLFVEVRISRFFKLKYNSTVTYKLRDGKTTSEPSQPQTITFAGAKRINEARV